MVVSAKVANHLFTVVPPCYELTTLLIRTLTYELGQSGIARRDKHGQLSHNTPYPVARTGSVFLASTPSLVPECHRAYGELRP